MVSDPIFWRGLGGSLLIPAAAIGLLRKTAATQPLENIVTHLECMSCFQVEGSRLGFWLGHGERPPGTSVGGIRRGPRINLRGGSLLWPHSPGGLFPSSVIPAQAGIQTPFDTPRPPFVIRTTCSLPQRHPAGIRSPSTSNSSATIWRPAIETKLRPRPLSPMIS